MKVKQAHPNHSKDFAMLCNIIKMKEYKITQNGFIKTYINSSFIHTMFDTPKQRIWLKSNGFKRKY